MYVAGVSQNFVKATIANVQYSARVRRLAPLVLVNGTRVRLSNNHTLQSHPERSPGTHRSGGHLGVSVVEIMWSLAREMCKYQCKHIQGNSNLGIGLITCAKATYAEQRREWDSNPRILSDLRFSRPVR